MALVGYAKFNNKYVPITSYPTNTQYELFSISDFVYSDNDPSYYGWLNYKGGVVREFDVYYTKPNYFEFFRQSHFESPDENVFVGFPIKVTSSNFSGASLYGTFYSYANTEFRISAIYTPYGDSYSVDITPITNIYVGIAINTSYQWYLHLKSYDGSYVRDIPLYTISDNSYTLLTTPAQGEIITIYSEKPQLAEFLGHTSNFQTDWNPSIGYVNSGSTYDLTYHLRVSESETIDPFTDVTVTFTSPGVDDPGTLATWADGKLTVEPNLKVIGFTITATANGYVDSEGNPLTDSIFVNVLDSIYNEGGTSIGGIGGGGSFTGPGGSWGNGIGPSPSTSVVGDLPNGSAEQDSSRTGLFTRYGMSASQLYAVGAALYVEDILANIGKEIMSFLWNSPSEALISLISYPFSVTELVGSTATNIKFGSLQLEVTGNALSGTFAQIDWGTIQLEEFWGNFLDYAPHTKIDLYLPWCTGTVPVDTHECLPGSITVKTNIELSKGTCVHNVFGNKGALIGTYSGTCGSQLPMTSLDTAGKALALVTAAAGTLVAGAAAGGAKSAGITAANTPPKTLGLSHSELISDQLARIKEAEAPYRKIQKGAQGTALASSIAAFRNPAHVVRNGSFSASGAGMGMQFPFIIISRPEQNIPDGYGHYYGYPSNVYTRLGAVSGYAEIGSIHLDGFSTATADELIEIESLLKEGVIF